MKGVRSEVVWSVVTHVSLCAEEKSLAHSYLFFSLSSKDLHSLPLER